MTSSMVLAVASFFFAASASPTNLCSTDGLCCKHRDSGCVVQRVYANHTVDTSELPCYCDHACIHLEDCCPDYKDFCSVSDCRVSEWGPWSPCDSDCGLGKEERHRVVLHHPVNGGQKCPHLTQSRECRGIKCEEEVSEAPSSNTLVRTNHRPEEEDKFCMEMVVIRSSTGCHKHGHNLHVGTRICIECPTGTSRSACARQLTASQVRQFRIDQHCHGKLTFLESQATGCACEYHFRMLL